MAIADGRYRGSREYLLVYGELIQAARYQGVTTYQAVAEILGIRQPGHHMASEVGHVLGEISEDEVRHGRPMLSALAVGVNGRPGPGFFTLARALGLLGAEPAVDEMAFWQEQRAAVYAAWKREFE